MEDAAAPSTATETVNLIPLLDAGNMEDTLTPSTATVTPNVSLFDAGNRDSNECSDCNRNTKYLFACFCSRILCCCSSSHLAETTEIYQVKAGQLIQQNVQERATDEGLSDKLSKEGLHGRYWSDILAHHQVHTMEQLTALSDDDSVKILSNARYQSELEKMKEVTGYRSDFLSSKTKVSYRLENVSSYIEELLTDAGYDPNIEFVKVKLSKLYDIMGVHDNEWHDFVDMDHLNIFLSQLQKEVCLLKRIQESIELMSDNTLVTEASGGLSLTGVLVRCGKVVPGKRNQVIQCPTISSLHPCPDFHDALTIEFTCKQQEQDFYNMVNNGFFKLAIENLRQNHHTNAQSPSQIIFTKYMTSQFTLHSKELTDKALETLGTIDTDLSSNIDKMEIANKCLAFFQSFGSHVSNSSVCLGAYSIAAYQGEGHSASELVAKPVTHGGVEGITTPAIWRLGLVNDCRTWKVIDRGVIDDMIGVWSLVETHSNSLKNPEALSKILKETWEENFMIEKKQNPDQGDSHKLCSLPGNVERIPETGNQHKSQTTARKIIDSLEFDQVAVTSKSNSMVQIERIASEELDYVSENVDTPKETDNPNQSQTTAPQKIINSSEIDQVALTSESNSMVQIQRIASEELDYVSKNVDTPKETNNPNQSQTTAPRKIIDSLEIDQVALTSKSSSNVQRIASEELDYVSENVDTTKETDNQNQSQPTAPRKIIDSLEIDQVALTSKSNGNVHRIASKELDYVSENVDTPKETDNPNQSQSPAQIETAISKDFTTNLSPENELNDGKHDAEQNARPASSQFTSVNVHRHILDKLHISEYYPCKLTSQELSHVQVNGKEPTLAFTILKKILCCDSSGRDSEVDSVNNASSSSFQTITDDILDAFDDDLECDDQLNASDVFLAIYSCCDMRLKKAVCEKLFVCKQAIPLIIPDVEGSHFTYGLWNLRQIAVDYHDENGKNFQASLATQPLRICSFVRFDNCHMSKSKMLNDLLNEQQHDTFFNKDCPTGDVKSALSKGLVDVSLYLPSGKGSDRFEETIAFLNLHGDCLTESVPSNFLISVSDTILVLMPLDSLMQEKTVMKLQTMTAKVFVIMIVVVPPTSDDRRTKGILQNFRQKNDKSVSNNIKMIFTRQRGKEKGAASLTTELANHIRNKTTAVKQSFEFHAEEAKQPTLVCDEESEPCKDMKIMAQSIMTHFNGKDLVTCKKKLLPLQGQLWKKWSNLQRKQHGTRGNIHDQDEIYKEMEKLRKEQAEKSISSMMKEFIDTLVGHDAVRQIYFLQWLQIYLDNKSRKDLPVLKNRWHELKLKFEKRKREKNVEQKKLSELQEEVDAAELKFVEASIGIEHFFREIGQIYEVSRKNVSWDANTLSMVNKLPSLVAKMLLSGSTFEIMDGDAANIPLTWIQAVFKEMVTLVGDRHVFVLSVIGIQSSGKSTMLNAMFGLSFPVSAGRCTRGLFMKILPVCHSEEGAYDYMLVVDTEGLRSQEALSQMHHHDNMLTTLVIGIADLTLVNIKGENQSEMKDVLQIAVHAFLKMKLANSGIKLQQKCVFVHQNVPAVDASSNLSHAQIKMVDELNEMTKVAAENEGICHIDRFEEVIEFKAQSRYDLWYFSDCWKGDPPMAPSNPGYSEMVMKCRRTILEDVVQNETYFTFSDFVTHLTDIWNGALSLDFVFSFRNSLEIKSNNMMDKIFRGITRRIEEKISDWMRQQKIKIGRCETEDDLSRGLQDSIQSLQKEIQASHSTGKEELNEFFQTNNMRTITAQWESHKKKSLQHSCDDLQRECETNLHKMKKSRLLDLLQQDKLHLQRAVIARKAIEAGTKLKDESLSDSDLEYNFVCMWKEFEHEFQHTLAGSSLNIVSLCCESLSCHFKDQRNLISETLPQIRGDDIMNILTCMKLDKTCVSVPKFLDRVKLTFAQIVEKKDWTSQITEITRSILKNVEENMNAVRQRKGDIEKRDIDVLLNSVTSKVEEHNMNNQEKFKLLPPYTVKLAEYVIAFAEGQFQKVHENFEKHHGIIAKMKQYRQSAFTIFVNTAKKTKAELMTAQFVSHIITPKIEDMLHHDLQTKLTNRVLTSLGSMKGQLIINILDELADRNQFSAFIAYITSPSTFAETWIREHFERELTSKVNTSDSTIYVAETRIILKRIILSVEKAIASMDSLSGDLEQWVSKFCENTSKELILTKQDFQEIIDSQKTEQQTKMEKLSQHVVDLLPGIENSILSKYEKHVISKVTWKEPVPFKEIFDKIWGCKEICPFCHEPCMKPGSMHNAEEGTPHFTVQHKPQGCHGQKWRKSRKLVIEPCNYSVTTDIEFNCASCKYNCRKLGFCKENEETFHPYKEYKKYVPEWDIPPNPVIDSCKYWMWFMFTFQDELIEYYGYEKPDIPEAWGDIDVKAAKDSLRQYHN